MTPDPDLPLGWHIYQLCDSFASSFQPRADRWTCSLRNPVLALVAHGHGPSAQEAIDMALNALDFATPSPRFEAKPEARTFDLMALIRSPKPRIRRRV